MHIIKLNKKQQQQNEGRKVTTTTKENILLYVHTTVYLSFLLSASLHNLGKRKQIDVVGVSW